MVWISLGWFVIIAWVFIILKIIEIRRSKKDNTYNKHMLISFLVLILPYPVMIIAFFFGDVYISV